MPPWETFLGNLFRLSRVACVMKTHVGVSGFSYASWKGKFYPSDSKTEEFLSLYSKRLGSVEINSSFYAPPSAATLKSWSAKTSEDFVFSFKAPRLITHILKLDKGSLEAADKFSRTLDYLGPRRGPILFQLPPFLKADLALLGNFLADTSDIRDRVFEFRHESWLNGLTYALLDKNGAGFCIAETEDLDPVLKVTGGLAYFRLRLDSYDGKAIGSWVEKIKRTAKGSRDCYVYFRHDETGENAIHAEKLSSEL